MESGERTSEGLSSRVAMALLAACILAVLALRFFNAFRPFDMWWAGSVWSRPDLIFWADITAQWGLLLALVAIFFSAPAGEERSSPRWRWALPIIFAASCLLLPSDGALGDRIWDYREFQPSQTAPLTSIFVYVFQWLGDVTLGSTHAGIRALLVVLGLVWTTGLLALCSELLPGRRGVLLAAGLTFSLPAAQFAGYFEISGMGAAVLPWVVWFCANPRAVPARVRPWLCAPIIAIVAGLHGSLLCVAPAIALACFFDSNDEKWGSEFALKPRAMAFGGVALLFGVAGFFLIEIAMNALLIDLEVVISDKMAGNDHSPLVPIVRTQLTDAFYAYYTFLSAEYFHERLAFLSITGAGTLFALVGGLASLRVLSRRAFTLLVGGGGAFAAFALWNLDWGMVRDWNLVAQWIIGAALFALALAAPTLSRLPTPGIIVLAGCFAVPGIVLTVHNAVIGAQTKLPDVERWLERTPDHLALKIAEDSPEWDVVQLGQPIALARESKVTMRVAPMNFTEGIIDRMFFESEEGQIVAVEAESLVSIPADSDAAFFDNEWHAAPHERAFGGGYAGAARSEKVPPLEWTVTLPPGTWQPSVRSFSTWLDPPGMRVVFEYEIIIH